jgi:hypothetical protein
MKKIVIVGLLLVGGASWAQDKDKKAAAPAATAPAAGAPAPAAAPKPMPAPTPDKVNEGLKPFAGSWTCEGKGVDPVSKAEFTYKSSVKNTWDLNNFWLDIKYKRDKGKMMPAFVADAEWGFDAAQKKFVFEGVDSWGGHISVTSAGPTGNTIVWEGNASMMGQVMPVKMTVARDDKGHGMNFKMESNGQVMFADTCK